MSQLETFGQMVKRLRRERNEMTLRELAKELEVSFPYLSQIEADAAKPSEELVTKIAKFFKQDAESLMFLAREVEKAIEAIKEKYPTVAPKYFRKALRND